MEHAPRRRPAALRATLARSIGACALAAATLFVTPGTAAAAQTQVVLTGHGFGHGRGMGQWGAFGYASQYGWGYQQILAHYYGGTTLATVPDSVITVHLTALDGADTVAAGLSGAQLAAAWPGGSAKGAAVRVAHRAGVQTVFTGPGCSGPWTQAGTTTSQVTVGSAIGGGPTPAAPSSSEEQVCEASGTVAYQGQLVSTAAAQTDNLVPLEAYVEGVVPREMPASWASAGGQAALEAQAIAARSYALAVVAANGQICDSTACQVYGGVPSQWGMTADSAVAATAGQVLVCSAGSACGPSGSVALTEYSASTGGYSAGGAFPAVPDAGDAVAGNVDHAWSVTLAAATLDSAFPSIGAFQALTVTERNGLGDLGGRVLSATVSGSAGSVVVTGDQFAAIFGLPSNWWAVVASPSVPAQGSGAGQGSGPTSGSGGSVGSAPPASVPGYWLADRAGGVAAGGAAPAEGTAAGTVLAGSTAAVVATPDGGGYWLAGSGGGVLAFGDARWYGSASHLALPSPVVAMAATPDGGGYWLVTAKGNVYQYGDAGWYGSPFASHRMLPAPVVAVVATPDGRGYWLVTSAGNVISYGDAGWWGSPAYSRWRLPAPVVAAAATSDGRGYWLVTSAGNVYNFGDAGWWGSPAASGARAEVASVAADSGGYALLMSDGSVTGWGDLSGLHAATPTGWLAPGAGLVLRP